MVQSWLDAATSARVIDLGQPYYPGMPHHPTHPPFLFGLVKKHGDYIGPGGVSSAAESIALGGHVGTHIDALCHFSCDGRLHNGDEVAPLQSYAGGIQRLGVDGIAPIVRRGVLLDIAHVAGCDILPRDFEVTPHHLDRAAQNKQIGKGDVVLLRTGWARYWDNAAQFIAQVHGPGPCADGARWLSERGIFAAGSDTVAFERVPAPAMPVHVHLLVERGIHIMECLNLEELAASGVSEFLFIAAPLKLRGGTGAPIRPLAIL